MPTVVECALINPDKHRVNARQVLDVRLVQPLAAASVGPPARELCPANRAASALVRPAVVRAELDKATKFSMLIVRAWSAAPVRFSIFENTYSVRKSALARTMANAVWV
jgi:hypothetical protein